MIFFSGNLEYQYNIFRFFNYCIFNICIFIDILFKYMLCVQFRFSSLYNYIQGIDVSFRGGGVGVVVYMYYYFVFLSLL